MAVNLTALSNTANAITALSNLILVSPEDKGYQAESYVDASGVRHDQPPAFLFNYEGEQSYILQSDITDHYVEDNTAIQDQIALRPEMITTSGFIGELNDIPPNQFLSALKTIAEKLTVISAYTPQLSITARITYNRALFLYSIANSVLNTAEAVISQSLFGAYPQNKQQKAFQQFFQWWQNRVLFTVQTPWGTRDHMAIHTIRAIQDESTRVISNFEITFKRMNFASTETFANQQPNTQGQLKAQSASLTNNGTQTLSTSSTTFSSSLASIA